jgi:hypothetical protein
LTGQNTFVPGRGSTRYKCAAFVPDISPGTNAPPHLYRMFCTGTNEDYRIGTNAHFSSSGCYRSLVSAVPHSFLEIESLFSLLRFSLMTNDHGCGLELASLSASSIHNVGSSNFPGMAWIRSDREIIKIISTLPPRPDPLRCLGYAGMQVVFVEHSYFSLPIYGPVVLPPSIGIIFIKLPHFEISATGGIAPASKPMTRQLGLSHRFRLCVIK